MYTTEQTIIKNLHKVTFCCNGCWEWTGKDWVGPYAKIHHNNKRYYVHRFFYEYFTGTMLHNKEIDHLCKNTWCCNPEHLEAVDRETNINRSNGITVINANKVVCKRGHAFTRSVNGKRICQTCKTDLQRARRKQ